MTSPGAKKGLRLGGGDGVRYEETERLSRSSSSVAELYTVPYDDILKAVVELGVTSIEVFFILVFHMRRKEEDTVNRMTMTILSAAHMKRKKTF
jgi:hypothetical protein